MRGLHVFSQLLLTSRFNQMLNPVASGRAREYEINLKGWVTLYKASPALSLGFYQW
jgi:hypothetical protein